MDYSIGIIGVGVLGKAILESFISIKSIYIKCYDKYRIDNKNITINNHIYHDIYVSKIEELCHCDILFLCLPTEYDTINKEYNKKEINSVLYELAQLNYKGILLLKSTVEPKTTYNLSQLYPQLTLIHNPEFLTARTATHDFRNQTHIVLGLNNYNSTVNYDNNNYSITYIKTFFETYFKDSTISICSSDESESMKLFCNSFYATKIQYFTEVKLLCDKMDIEYNNVIDLMLKNGWINPMHTNIPGHDGELSFGGKCLPKDINALSSLCNTLDSPNKVIQAVVNENNIMRNMNL
jgi:UDPglucose 6-dehydrogenase